MIKQFLVLMTFTVCASASAQWKSAGNKMKTSWADKIDVNKVLPEYPRPIMEREQWQNLNGLWNYAILPAGKSAKTASGPIPGIASKTEGSWK